MAQFSSISRAFWLDTDTLLVLTPLVPFKISLLPGLSKEVSQIKQTLAGAFSIVWVEAVLQQHLVKVVLQQSSAAGAQCSTPVQPSRYIGKLWPGRFLVLEDLGWCWIYEKVMLVGLFLPLHFMEDAQCPFRLMHLDGSISSCHCLSAGVWDLNAVSVQKSQHWLLRQKETENSLHEDEAAGLFAFI